MLKEGVMAENKNIPPKRPQPTVRKTPARAPKSAPLKAPARPNSLITPDNKPKTSVEAPKLPPKKQSEPKIPARPLKSSAQAATVENKNLNVVEKALSIEELNARKQRRIRNGTYTLSAIATILIIALILIIFWPAPKSVEAVYDFTINGVPSVTNIEHLIRSDEVTGNVVTFKEPISIKNSENNSNYLSMIIQPTFKADGIDITNQIYLQLVYENSEDIYNIDNIKTATVGSLENIPSYQIYVDLDINPYVYFTNVLAGSDESYPLVVGFMAKDNSLLTKEITMQIKVYGLNAENLELINTVNGSYIRLNNETTLPAESTWISEVQENLNQKKS